MSLTLNLPVFEKIYIDIKSESSDVAARVRSLYPAELIQTVDESQSDLVFLNQKGTMSADEFNLSKKTLLLTTYKGQFFKRCPARPRKRR